MSPEEQALADKSPTFADLCDRMRQARRNHIRAMNAVEAAESNLKVAQKAEADAVDLVEKAEDTLRTFIDRETAVEGGK